jgi:hypothetical protein
VTVNDVKSAAPDQTGRRLPGRRRPKTGSVSDEGSIGLFVVVVVLGLFAVLGLVVDGSARLVAQQRASNEAEQAARAGAQAVNITGLRDGNPVALDPVAAAAAARNYLTALPDLTDPQITVVGDTVTVTVHSTVQPAILSIAGINALTVTGHGSARLLRGATAQDAS